jgi:hypothetical protein
MDEYRTIDKRLEHLASETTYPPTPDIARSVAQRLKERRPWQRRRGVAWGMAVLALVLIILVAVPGVRAEILRILRVGVVQILISPPEPALTSPATSAATAAQNTARLTATLQNLPSPTQAYTTSLLPLGAETSLETAAQLAGFPLLLPGYPPDLGAPDKAYYQPQGPVVVMVWLEPGEGERVQMSLHAIGPDSIALRKHQPEIVQETTVNGGYALWTVGPYLLETASGEYSYFRLVEGHTLIWDEGEITYRLESALPLEEAVRVAESLQ